MVDHKEIYGTDSENKWAEKYDVLVKKKLKGKINRYLQTNNVKKSVITDRIKEIQDLYIAMFDIQYEISQIEPEALLNDGSSDDPIFAWVIDAQAKNWLNRLSSTLNVLTIKASEFSERKAKRRDYFLFSLSIFISTIIGAGTNWCFDYYNDKDLNNQTLEIEKHQNSITNKIRQEYILNFDTLKYNKNNSQKHKIIENQNKLKDKNNRQKYNR